MPQLQNHAKTNRKERARRGTSCGREGQVNEREERRGRRRKGKKKEEGCRPRERGGEKR